MTSKHVYEVTTVSGYKARIRAARFDVIDQIVVFEAKKSGKAGRSGVAVFPVGQLGSVVRADATGRSGRTTTRDGAGAKARSSKKTSASATRRRPRSSNGSSPARAGGSKVRSRTRARGTR